jgi:hypothetical protein
MQQRNWIWIIISALLAVGCDSESDTALVGEPQGAAEIVAGDQPVTGQSAPWRRTKPDDVTPPPEASAFSAKSGPWIGQITLAVAYPDIHGDYAKIDFHRQVGSIPPDACSAATLALSTTTFSESSFLDHGLYPGDNYSYTACIYDAAGNVTMMKTDSQTAAGTVQRIFVTSDNTFDGNLKATYKDKTFSTGLEGGDYRCQSLAEGAGIVGKFKALLGSLPARTPYYQTDIYGQIYNLAPSPELVAHNRSDLWRGDIRTPIGYDEFGQAVAPTYDANAAILSGFVYSGIYSSGGTTATYTCADWTDNSTGNFTVAGDSTKTTDSWLWTGSGLTCDVKGRLYCLETIDNSVIPKPTLTVAAGSTAGELSVGIAFPTDTSRYWSVRLKRNFGSSFAEESCASGSEIAYYNGGTDSPFTSEIVTDNIGAKGWYSYSACVWDVFGNLLFRVASDALVTGTTADYKRAFITASSYDGNLGGIAGANTKCSTAATNAVPALTGTWKALIADSTKYIYNNYNIAVSQGTFDFVGNFVASYTSGLFPGAPTAAEFITTDENGLVFASGTKVWTGSSAYGYHSGSSCTDWTSNSSSIFGTTGVKSASWTMSRVSETSIACNGTAHLYCIEQ